MSLELMSPAGNIDSFLAAIDGGADSVYLGWKKFNARRPAQNFTSFQLKKAVIFAHEIGKKIYLVLNIDLKSNELKEAVEIVEFAVKINIDGIIIKDPAILYILKEFYKDKIEIHFSTQNAIESSFGVRFAVTQKIKRIVLARELDLDEIKKCVEVDGIEIEIFTEGSMCFSVSGRCLMSSWVGGHSGNRGACTAPCRILWTSNEKQFSYFSMKDLSLIENLKDLQKIGIAALKIEGRLKNAMWVKTITSIYREALDNVTDFEKLKKLNLELKKYSAREKADGHIKQHNNLIGKNEEWENYQKLNEEYNFSGKNIFEEKNEIFIFAEDGFLKIVINLNDNKKELNYKLPPLPKKANPVLIENLTSIFRNGEFLGKKFEIKINDPEIETSSSFLNKVSQEIITEIRKLINKNEELPKSNDEILKFISPLKQELKRTRLIGEKPDKIIIFPEQIEKILNLKINFSEIVIYLISPIDTNLLKELQKKHKIIFSIPPILFENEAIKTNKVISILFAEGFTNFEANSYTGIEILSKLNCTKTLGFEFPVFNHIAAEYFYNLAYKSIYVSPEADSSVYKALSSFAKGSIDCLVFGRLALFQSRVESDNFKNGKTYKDKYSELECFKICGINYFVNKKPFSLIGNNFKKENIYFDKLSCDLRFFKEPDKIFNLIIENRFDSYETSGFNFNTKLL